MLQNSKRILSEMLRRNRCVVAINVHNMETVQAVFAAAKRRNVPAIIAFGESYLDHANLETIASIVYSLDRTHELPIVLHLDHSKSFDTIKEAIDAGFTSVMYDGSSLPFEQNLANTAKVVEYAHKHGVTVEAELGYMNPEHGSDFLVIGPETYTDPVQAEVFVNETGVDSLAIAVGNAHGLYKAEPSLDLERIRLISTKTKVPLVLHGSSGIPRDQLKAAVLAGIAKINVNTEVALAAGRTATDIVSENTRPVRLEEIMRAVQKSLTEAIGGFLELTE